MRVLLTTPYDLAVPGGVNRHARDLLDTLTRRGIDARLLGPASAACRDETINDPRIVRLGRVHVKAMNGAQSRVTLDGTIGGAVRRLMREFKPDVIHMHEPFLPLLNTFCLWHAGCAATVGTFHTYSENSRGYLWAWPYCRWVGRRLHARVAVSVPAREFAARYHPGEYAIVPSGVRAVGPAQRRAIGPVRRPVRVLFVGRSDESRKGFGVLLAAIRRLQREAPGEFALTVVGPGAEAWKGTASVEGVPVRWTGQVADAELSAAYATADVCVVPSLGGESFGLVALESLAHGVPVVVSRIRGYAEWLEQANVGTLIPSQDESALAGAIRSIGSDPVKYAAWSQRALALAARFDWDEIAGRLVKDVYRRAVSNAQGCG